MTITPMTPVVTRLGRDVDRGEEMLARVRSSLGNAGDGARAFTRCAVAVQSAAEVDAFAAKWGVTPAWTAGRTQYLARWIAGGHEAEAEVVYYAPAPEAAGSEAAA